MQAREYTTRSIEINMGMTECTEENAQGHHDGPPARRVGMEASSTYVQPSGSDIKQITGRSRSSCRVYEIL